MAGKSKKHTKVKVTQKWAIWLINLNIGPHLSMLGMIQPNAADELMQLLLQFVIKEGRLEKYEQDPDQLVSDMSAGVHRLYGIYCGAKLKTYVMDGVPDPKIIMPSNLRNIKSQSYINQNRVRNITHPISISELPSSYLHSRRTFCPSF